MTGGSDTEYRTNVQRTYRYLRLGMAVLIVLLAAAVAIDSVRSGNLQASVSAYYYTPAHSVFVAAVCAIGACLVIYRGRSDVEDVVLNGAGFLAFVVAFVPTARGEAECDPSQSFCRIPDSTIEANLLALMIAGGLGLTIGYLVSIRPRQEGRFSQPVDRAARWAFVVLCAGYIVLLAGFLGWRDTFLRIGHYSAAGALLLAMFVVVVLNGVELERRNRDSGGRHAWLRRWYWGSLAFMVVAAVTIVLLRDRLEHWLFFLEASVVAGFAVFWLTQTVGEVWNEPARPDEETDHRSP